MPEPASPGAKPDIFVSYARPDRAAAQKLAEALAGAGLSVWWDHELAGGDDFADVIAEQLDAARIVIVLWSRTAVVSDFVRDEATRARQAGKLLPVRIEEVQPPLGFGTIHTLDLIGWDGDADDGAFRALLADVRRGTGRGQGPAPLPPQPPWWRRWRRPLTAAVVVIAAVGGGYAAWDAWREQQALKQLQVGLEAHFARDRNLQVARNAYLSALRDNPRLGRAHYYLGHVYALLILPGDARTQFALALRFASDLDAAQREDARAQLAALGDVDAVAPVTRAVPAPSPGVAAPARPPAAAPAAASAAPPARPTPSRPTVGAVVGSVTGTGSGAIAGAIAGASTRLPRMAPSPEQQRTIEARAAALFSPDAQTRLEAATALAVDPGLAADAMPLAIDRSLAALRDAPGGVATATGVANTMQLLLAASPATLRAHADDARRLAAAAQALGDNQRAAAQQLARLVDQAASEKPPVAYIQIASDAQRELARQLAMRIRAAGYTVPAAEKVGDRAPARTEVRVQGGSAPGWGRWLAKVVGETTDETVQPSTLRAARPANDTFEIWLDKDLCVTRRVAACGD